MYIPPNVPSISTSTSTRVTKYDTDADANVDADADVDLLTTQEGNIDNLLTFVTENLDCIHLDTVLKLIITHLSDKTRIKLVTENSSVPLSISTQNTDHIVTDDDDEYSRFCTTASYSICRFLKNLSANGKIEVFRDHCQAQDQGQEQEHDETPVQQYRSFKECTDREWRTIKLLQTACVQLLNLKHPAVIPDLLVILSSLSTHQLVPYSYWSQAIQLCADAKKWEDLKVLLQVRTWILASLSLCYTF